MNSSQRELINQKKVVAKTARYEQEDTKELKSHRGQSKQNKHAKREEARQQQKILTMNLSKQKKELLVIVNCTLAALSVFFVVMVFVESSYYYSAQDVRQS